MNSDELPKYGADSALSSLVKRQITGSSDFGTSTNPAFRFPCMRRNRFHPGSFHSGMMGRAQFPRAGQLRSKPLSAVVSAQDAEGVRE